MTGATDNPPRVASCSVFPSVSAAPDCFGVGFSLPCFSLLVVHYADVVGGAGPAHGVLSPSDVTHVSVIATHTAPHARPHSDRGWWMGAPFRSPESPTRALHYTGTSPYFAAGSRLLHSHAAARLLRRPLARLQHVRQVPNGHAA